MKFSIRLVDIGLALFLLLYLVPRSQAQLDSNSLDGTGYDLTWSSIDGGGGQSSGGGYTLDGTIGQPDAVGQVANLPYTLAGGFWNATSPEYRVYLPLVLRVE